MSNLIIHQPRASHHWDRPHFFRIQKLENEEIKTLKLIYDEDIFISISSEEEGEQYIKDNIVPKIIKKLNEQITFWKEEMEQWRTKIKNNTYPEVWKSLNIEQGVIEANYHPLPDLREFINDKLDIIRILQSENYINLFTKPYGKGISIPFAINGNK